LQYRCSTGILNNTMAWTQRTIDSLKPKVKSYKNQENNLIVKVQPTGHITFYAYIKRQSRFLGNHPELTLRQARMKKEELFHDMYMGKIEPTKETFKDFVNSQDFQDWSSGERKTHDARMASMKATILPILGHVKLAQLDKTDIQRYKNKRLKSVKKTTINRELNDIQAVLTQAKEMNRIHQPIKAKKYSEDRGTERRILEDSEVRALRDSAHSIEGLSKYRAKQKKHIGLVVDIALWCGLRKGEILALTWGNIINKGHYLKEMDKEFSVDRIIEDKDNIYVSEDLADDVMEAGLTDYAFEIKGSNTKTGQSRWVPIAAQLFKELILYYTTYVAGQESMNTILETIQEFNKATRKEMSDKDFKNPFELQDISFDKLFFQEKHKKERLFPFSKVDNSFNTARNNAGLDKSITLHSLRHNFCSKALEAGMSLHTVKDLAGHASITTTEIYLHTNPRLKFMEYQRFNKAMEDITIGS